MRLTGPRHLVGRLVLPLINRRSCRLTVSLDTGSGMGSKLRRVLSRFLVGPLPFCYSSATNSAYLVLKKTYVDGHV